MTTPNTTCLYPQFAVSTASNKGCRCERCCSYTRNRRKAWYSKNAEQAKEKSKQYNKNNREKVYERKKKYSKNNRNKINLQKQQWLQNPSNTIKENINSAKHRAIRIGGLGCVPSLNPDEQVRLYKIYETRYYLSESTGVMHHVDHIVPISKKGLHHPDNLQVLTATENQKKNDKIL